jgi:hypothetical protein
LYILVQVDILLLEFIMASTIHAVLIADVMASSSRKNLRELLGKKLAGIATRHLRRGRIDLPYSVTAGDEFQTITRNLAAIPSILLELRAALRPLSLRIGVGFGRINGRVQAPVNRLGGEAFQSARKAIESVKAGSLFKFEVLTAFHTSKQPFNEAINLIYGLQDTLVLKVTEKQWQAIEEFLANPSLERSSRHLKLDPSTVSRNLKRGYYWQVSETVKVAESLIKRTFS